MQKFFNLIFHIYDAYLDKKKYVIYEKMAVGKKNTQKEHPSLINSTIVNCEGVGDANPWGARVCKIVPGIAGAGVADM